MYRTLTLLAISLAVWGIGEGMFILFTPIYLQEFGADPQLIGGILGLIGAAMTISHIPAGYLSDRLGRLPLLRTAWLMGLLATLIMALSKTLPVYAAGAVLYGLTAFVASPLSSYVTAARGRLSVGRVLTISSAAFSTGAILGPLMGGWLGEHYGRQAVFWAACGLFVISTLVVFWLPPQPVESHAHAPWYAVIGRTLKPVYVQFLLITFLVIFCLYLPQPLTPNFLQNERGLTKVELGGLIAGRGAGIVLLNLVLGQMNPRIGLLLSQAGVAAFTLLIWQGSGFPLFFLGYMLMGSFQTARSLLVAQGRALVETANQGLAYGMIETVGGLTTILAPPLAGFLYGQGPALVYPTSLGLIMLAFIIAKLFTPAQAR